MAKTKDCERCGRRFLAEPNEPVLCILCLADYEHEQLSERLKDADELDNLIEDSDNANSRDVSVGNNAG